MDCMIAMKEMRDKEFELAICDPPYGIARFGNRVELSNRICSVAKINTWDTKPSEQFFNDLFRVSKYQIIWGANNFTLPQTEYFIVWDKQQTVDNFASAELAWTNIKMPAKIFRYSIHKEMADRKSNGGKIHPTQKPVKLYEWLLTNYAKQGDTILDTHLGSGSIAIACYNLDFDLVGYEIDEQYFKAAKDRLERHQRQFTLFGADADPAKEDRLSHGKGDKDIGGLPNDSLFQ